MTAASSCIIGVAVIGQNSWQQLLTKAQIGRVGVAGRSLYKGVSSNYNESQAYPSFLLPYYIGFIWRRGREVDVSKKVS